MMRSYYLFILLLVAALFISCEKEIDYQFNKKEKLVVLSQFTDNNALDVLVFKTSSFESNPVTEFVTDATVLVFSDGEFLEALDYVPRNDATNAPSFYRSKKLKPETGKVYLIKVSVPGFDPITAENSIPVAVPIQSVQFTSNLNEDVVNDKDFSLDFDVAVTIFDPADVKNFYHLIFYQQLISYTISPDRDTIRGDTSYAKPASLSLKDPNLPLIKNFDNRGFLAEDKTFNGQKMVFGATGSYSFDPQHYLPGDFLIELRTVSEAYYYHYSTLTLQDELGNNPFAEGVVIYDNIENGVGIFAGYSSSVNSFQLNN
jgi:hypothetical protein